MPKKQQNVRVVKVPLKRPPADYPQVFPRMPRLYLELLENKAKIKQDLINKEHVPAASVSPLLMPKYSTSADNRIPERSMSSSSDSEGSPELSRREVKPPPKKGNEFESRLDRLLSDDSDKETTIPSVKDTESDSSSPSEKSIKEDKKGDDNSSTDDSDDLSIRLKQLLNEDSESELSFDKFEKSLDRSKSSHQSDKYSRHRDSRGHSVPLPGAHGSAPTLAELEQRGGYVPRKELRDINQTSMNEQQEEDMKRELLFKFDLLRKSYPAASIPDYSIHTELNTLQRSYDDCVRRLSLDSTVESYKTYLVYGFMGCEFVFGNFLGFDMEGFTQQQIISMHSYEKLLIELGEKSYVPSGSKWPVELRLLFLIIMNAAFFVISKMIMKKTGSNLMGMINTMQGSNQQPSVTPGQSQRKRRMRGPNIDIGDIPDLNSPSQAGDGL